MLSHDLARVLLARRNHNVHVEVLVDDDPTGEHDPITRTTELRDDMTGSMYRIAADDLLVYDNERDVLVIRAGMVCVGGEPQ